MKRFLLFAVLALVGCKPATEIPDAPTYCLLVPKGDWQWKNELTNGFATSAAQFRLTTAVVEYAEPTVESIVTALSKAPDSKKSPVCIVFTRREIVNKVLDTAWGMQRSIITVGEDGIGGSRVGHCGDEASNGVYLWNIRLGQMNPRPKKVLLVLGEAPVAHDGIAGALYARSQNWTRYALRVRKVNEVSDEDFAWPDIISTVGEDALKTCLDKTTGRPIVPFDGSQLALDTLETGRAPNAFAPNYFQMGFRAARLARERFVTGTILTGSISLPYREIVKELIPWYKDTRYDVPPAVTKRGE